MTILAPTRSCTKFLDKAAFLNQTICGFCRVAYLSSCHRTASDATIGRSVHFSLHRLLCGGIRACLEFSVIQCLCQFLGILVHRTLVLVRSHQAEIIIVKRLIQRRNNVTRVGVEPKSCNQGRCKNNAFALSVSIVVLSGQRQGKVSLFLTAQNSTKQHR